MMVREGSGFSSYESHITDSIGRLSSFALDLT